MGPVLLKNPLFIFLDHLSINSLSHIGEEEMQKNEIENINPEDQYLAGITSELVTQMPPLPTVLGKEEHEEWME